MTPNILINEANSLTTSFQNVERKVQKAFRKMRAQALDLEDAGKAAPAAKLFDKADALSNELKKTRAKFYEADAAIDALLISDKLVNITTDQLNEQTSAARGHLDAISAASDNLEKLAQFTTFLVSVVQLINTVRGLAG